jgi:hypothetical protein
MKRLCLLFALLIGCSNWSLAQSSSPWSFGISFYPNQSVKSEASAIIVDYVDGASTSTEESKLAFVFGGTVSYQLSKHWEIQSGLLYDDKGYKIEEEFNRTNTGPGKATHNVHVNYLGIPLMVRYKFGQKDVRFFLGSGISSDFFLNTSGNASENFYPEYDFKTLGFSHIISLGGEWAINDKIRCMLEPMIRYPLVNYGSTNTFKPGSAGVSLSFAHSL